MPFGHLYVFFEKCLFTSSAQFLIGLFVFLLLSCLYVMEINPLPVAFSTDFFFPHSEDALFIPFMVLFAVQKFLSLIRSHLFIFV